MHSCGERMSSHEEDSPWLVWEFPLLLAPRSMNSTDKAMEEVAGVIWEFCQEVTTMLLPWDLG